MLPSTALAASFKALHCLFPTLVCELDRVGDGVLDALRCIEILVENSKRCKLTPKQGNSDAIAKLRSSLF